MMWWLVMLFAGVRHTSMADSGSSSFCPHGTAALRAAENRAGNRDHPERYLRGKNWSGEQIWVACQAHGVGCI
jgi:hypothetical protein